MDATPAPKRARIEQPPLEVQEAVVRYLGLRDGAATPERFAALLLFITRFAAVTLTQDEVQQALVGAHDATFPPA